MKKCKLKECSNETEGNNKYCTPEHKRIGLRRGRIELAMIRRRNQ